MVTMEEKVTLLKKMQAKWLKSEQEHPADVHQMLDVGVYESFLALGEKPVNEITCRDIIKKERYNVN